MSAGWTLTSEWRKPDRSQPDQFCVEARLLTDSPTGDVVEVRNSFAPAAGSACFSGDEWRVFLDAVRRGEFALPQ